MKLKINYKAKTFGGFFNIPQERFNELNKIFKVSPSQLEELISIPELLKRCENLWNEEHLEISFQEKIFFTMALAISLNYLCSPELQKNTN